MAGQTFFGGSLPAGKSHMGRSWSGPDPDHFDCECPRTECGLTTWGEWVPGCPYHGVMKTIRQSHPADRCPGKR